MFKNKIILISGGTGSFGKHYLDYLLNLKEKPKKIIIFSRDEFKQSNLEIKYKKYKNILRFFLGDVRDRYRLDRALEGVDFVIHAAALKQVPAAEYNPIEFIYTNVLGAENIIQASIVSGVKRVIALSTDKAAAPVNLYGATKLCSDKLFIAANNIIGKKDLRFSVVRYGNVLGSRGSVIPYFMECSKNGLLTITDNEMTRFNICLKEGVEMVIWSIINSIGGEIFVPKIPSYRVNDLAEAIGPNCDRKLIGLRPGEKIHEEMITNSDSYSTIDIGKYYAILPTDGRLLIKYKDSNKDFEEVPVGFNYSSDKNDHFLTVEEIRNLIKENIDPKFKPI